MSSPKEDRILPRKFLVPPDYILPLNDEELRELGTFTALWSQIDWMLFLTISRLTGTDLAHLHLMTENMTTGPRVNLLKKICSDQPTDTNKKLKKLCEDNSGLIEDRNHITHGLWAILWDRENQTVAAACMYAKNKRASILASKLEELSNRAAKFSNALGALLEQLDPLFAGRRPRRLVYYEDKNNHPSDLEPPPWPPK